MSRERPTRDRKRRPLAGCEHVGCMMLAAFVAWPTVYGGEAKPHDRLLGCQRHIGWMLHVNTEYVVRRMTIPGRGDTV